MDEQMIVWLSMLGIGIVVLICIIFFSFGSVAMGEVALDYSSLFKTIDTKAYDPGYHYIGLTHSFIPFPNIVQTIEFSMDRAINNPVLSRTLDGLEVKLEISFQYRLMPDKLYEMYMKYGEEYKKIFTVIAIDILTDMTTKFSAYKFFYDRQSIGDIMKKELSDAYKTYCYATVEFFQLRTVDLPDPFEGSIQGTEVQKQDIEKAKAEQQQVLVEWQTRIKEAELKKAVQINQALAEAQAIEQQNAAEVAAVSLTQLQQAEAYSLLQTHLGLTNAELLEFIKAKVVKEYKNTDRIVISLPKFIQ